MQEKTKYDIRIGIFNIMNVFLHMNKSLQNLNIFYRYLNPVFTQNKLKYNKWIGGGFLWEKVNLDYPLFKLF